LPPADLVVDLDVLVRNFRFLEFEPEPGDQKFLSAECGPVLILASLAS
jgi:hypothetical protein